MSGGPTVVAGRAASGRVMRGFWRIEAGAV